MLDSAPGMADVLDFIIRVRACVALLVLLLSVQSKDCYCKDCYCLRYLTTCTRTSHHQILPGMHVSTLQANRLTGSTPVAAKMSSCGNDNLI